MTDPESVAGPGPHPLAGGQRELVRFLYAASIAGFVFAAAGVFLPGQLGVIAGEGLIVTLIAVPILRVAWLFVRWLRMGDRRFAAVAAGLLVIIAVGAVLSLS